MRPLATCALLALTACGAALQDAVPTAAPEPAQVDPLPTPAPRDDPWALFASIVLDATRAAHAAVLGSSYDARWQCADAKRDIRSTEAQAGKTFLSRGAPEHILSVVSEVTLTSPLDASAAMEPADPNDDDRAQAKRPAHAYVRGTPFVFADGRVRWFKMSGRASTSPSYDGETNVRIKRLPPEIRGAIAEVVTALSSSCALPFVGERDLALLPIPASTKSAAIEAIEHEATELHHACELVARAPGPWEARIGRLQAIYAIPSGEMASLTTSLEIDQGRVCLGRVSAFVQSP